MDIFVGSSSEQKALLDDICVWIQQQGHTPRPWNAPDMFLPGESTFIKLTEIAKIVDAAVFIFSEDDKVWYRSDSQIKQPRDNVVLEYGLFCGALGIRRTAIIRHGSAKLSSDLDGIIYLSYIEQQEFAAKQRFNYWLRNIDQQTVDPAILKLNAELSSRKREIEELRRSLKFESSANSELKQIIDRGLSIRPGEWTLLFDRIFFWKVTEILSKTYSRPRQWHRFLDDNGLNEISNVLSWDRPDAEDRTRWFVTKTLSYIRLYMRADLYAILVERIPSDSAEKIQNIALERRNVEDL